MRILTVRNPWAQAIMWAGKDVENRVRNVAGSYRGPIALHAAKRVNTLDEWNDFRREHPSAARALYDSPAGIETFGAILGVVDLVDVHHAAECVFVGDVVEDFDGSFVSQEVTYCSPWAEDSNVYHLALANPRPLSESIPYRGALGLRRLDDDTTARILAQIGET